LYVIYRLHLEITSDRAAYLDLDCIICGKIKKKSQGHSSSSQNFQFDRALISQKFE